jgi:hypothetical protein
MSRLWCIVGACIILHCYSAGNDYLSESYLFICYTVGISYYGQCGFMNGTSLQTNKPFDDEYMGQLVHKKYKESMEECGAIPFGDHLIRAVCYSVCV